MMAWAGAGWVLAFFVGMAPVAQWIPLPSPADSAAEVAAMYRERTDEIRAGLILAFAGMLGYIFFSATLAAQFRRIKGVSVAARYTQVGALGACIVFILMPIVVWFAALYRPHETSPELLQRLNDLGWIMFIIAFVPFVAWVWSVGLCILSDESENPLYPRWSGWLSLLLGFLQIPPVVLPAFHDGPFAWDGLMCWWVPATDFFAFYLVMLALTIRAIKKPDPEPTQATTTEEPDGRDPALRAVPTGAGA